jgi:hypothetical protein
MILAVEFIKRAKWKIMILAVEFIERVKDVQ